MSDKPAEQAYHARGAGRLIERSQLQADKHRLAQRIVASPLEERYHAGYASACEDFIAALREPGADTGTTPQGGGRSPNDTSPMYSDDVIAAIRQQKQSTAAERGTTPPDIRPGMVAAINYCLFHYRNTGDSSYLNAALKLQLTLRDGDKVFEEAEVKASGLLQINYVERNHPQIIAAECVRALAKLGVITCQNDVKVYDAIAEVCEKAAATQRAPVEQGRDERYYDKFGRLNWTSAVNVEHLILQLQTLPPEMKVSSVTFIERDGKREARAYGLSMSYEMWEEDGWLKHGWTNKPELEQHKCLAIWATVPREGEPTIPIAAPDHAREGATMKCPKCGIDVFAHGETCPVSREGARERALANGKEGGE